MGYYTKNGGLIGTGAIEKVTGVSDIVTSQLFSGAGIFDDLIALSTTLASGAVATGTNFQSVQSTIETANSAFNVFAVVGYSDYSESLAGAGVAGGKRTHTAKGFNYNTSSSNILSTGNTIVDMTGGIRNGLGPIDGKKWMAMAQYDGTSFDGILVWIFTGDQVNNSGTITSGTRSVTNVRDIFYPDGVGSTNYHHFFPIAIDPNGTIYSNTNSGKCGWNFSNGQNPGSLGYNATTRFGSDDGIWGFIIPTGTNTGYVDGNAPGVTPKSTSSTTPGFGMGNYDGGDSNGDTYWNGVNTSSTNNVGFVFSGDA
jgi:hypothetical protein